MCIREIPRDQLPSPKKLNVYMRDNSWGYAYFWGPKRLSHCLSGIVLENLLVYIFYMKDMIMHIMLIIFGILNYFTLLK